MVFKCRFLVETQATVGFRFPLVFSSSHFGFISSEVGITLSFKPYMGYIETSAVHMTNTVQSEQRQTQKEKGENRAEWTGEPEREP